ncbi:MAG TPA: hypothetical protein VJM50_05135 [Pyrinomonadaceae bacterium]|nr:hypothetical protein [Pyrinomonadaceae bacterium]
MKRLLVLILVWTLLVVTGTLVSANGQARVNDSKNLISYQNVSDITEATNVIR